MWGEGGGGAEEGNFLSSPPTLLLIFLLSFQLKGMTRVETRVTQFLFTEVHEPAGS